MKRREFLGGLACLPFVSLPSQALVVSLPKQMETDIQRIAFGSCCSQGLSKPVFRTLQNLNPDLFAMIGDNIYADTEDMEIMRGQYGVLAADPDFAQLRNNVRVIATWDDHDFGINDGGVEYPKKNESKDIMLEFFGEPSNSERRRREGVYTSYFLGDRPRRLQIILLDLRWFRTPLILEESGYVPNYDPNATILGAEQWIWLDQQFKEPADFRILMSSTQCLPLDHQWEKWSNFPLERERLLTMIDANNVRNLVIASGDMHFGEISKDKTPAGHEIFEITSSGLNYIESAEGIPNRNRISIFDKEPNFGLITIDWSKNPLEVTLEVRTERGTVALSQNLKFPRLPGAFLRNDES